MAYVYTLTEEDYLNFQLFQASQSPRVRKKMRGTWIVIVLLMAVMGAFSWWTDRDFLALYFGGFTLIALFLYPRYQKARYKRHYRAFIKESYRERIGQEISMEFGEGKIHLVARTGKSEFNFEAVIALFETGEYLFIQLDSAQYITVPKQMEQWPEFEGELPKIGAPRHEMLDWEW